MARAWLQRANGFQRLWLVLSVLFVLYMTLVWPFSKSMERIGAEITRIGIEGDLDNPVCRPYQEKPLSELREPPNPRTNMPSTSTCWWLYHERRKKHYELPPYTREMLQADYPKWEGMLGYSATGLVLSITTSALVYGIGAVVAWVLRGFRHPGD